MTVLGSAIRFVSLLAALLLAGCSNGLDRDQARACRLVAEALTPTGTHLGIVNQRALPPRSAAEAKADLAADPDGAAIRIEERLTDSAGLIKTGFVECTFGQGADHRLLAGVRTARGELPLPQIFVLNRFWLTSADAVTLDPLPVSGADAVVTLPTPFGYIVQQVVNAVPSSAVYALLAAAYSLVYGLIGRINLAFGAFAAIGGTAALLAVLGVPGWPAGIVLLLAVVAALVPAACYGVAAARLVFQPLHRATGQQGLVATIGLALVLGEFLRLTQGAESHWIGPILDTPVALARDTDFVVTLTPIAALVSTAATVASLGVLWTMRYSAFGRQWRAYRDDPGAAALFGVGRDSIVGRTFALASALAGLAGGITVLFFGDISFAYAQTIGLKALAAAILGGIGSVPGALLGGLFIGLVESGWSAAFPIVYRDLVVFCILIAALMWRPGGFLGDRDLTPRRV